MRKRKEAALLAALLGTGVCFADIRTSVTVLQGQDIVTYRTADDSDKEAVGDTLGSQSGLGFFNDDYSKNRYTSFSLANDKCGASVTFKLNRDTSSSNGYQGYYLFDRLRVAFAGNGLGGFGDVTDHIGGEAYGMWYYTDSLYQWEMEYDDISSRRKNREYDDYTYNGYAMTNAGVPLANKDGGHEVGLSYSLPSAFGDFVLRAVLIHDRTSTKTGDSYFGWKNFADANAQINWTSASKKTKASLTVKSEGLTTWYSDSGDTDDDNTTKGIDLGICAALSHAPSKNVKFAFGWATLGKYLGENITATSIVDSNGNGKFGEDGEEETFSRSYWGHGLNAAFQYKYEDWTFTLTNQTTLIFLSEYTKAVSNAHKYGWKPYLGEIAQVSAEKKLKDTLSCKLAFTYRSYNLNSDTNGKAETALSLLPSLTFTPQKNCSLTVGIECSYENFSDTPKAEWGNSDAKVWAYVYPKTFTVQLPVTFNITL